MYITALFRKCVSMFLVSFYFNIFFSGEVHEDNILTPDEKQSSFNVKLDLTPRILILF